jgi:hypothetical protein
MSQEKRPSNKNKKLEDVLSARIILEEEAEDLKGLFDTCAKWTGDKYPRSDSHIGQSKKELRHGKEYTTYKTLQTEKFPEIFKILVRSKFFEVRMQELLGETSFSDFVELGKYLLSDEEEGEIMNKRVVSDSLGAMFSFCDKYRREIMPVYDFAPEDKKDNPMLVSSDILINLINNLIIRAQTVQI